MFSKFEFAGISIPMTTENQPHSVDDKLLATIFEAIQVARTNVQWKSGKDIQHLAKRIRLGHLSTEAKLLDYEAIIAEVLKDSEVRVYGFLYGDKPYPTMVATLADKEWLVIIGLDGVMETAFPPDDPASYLAEPAFVYVGVLMDIK
jgi:hypothetical protein